MTERPSLLKVAAAGLLLAVGCLPLGPSLAAATIFIALVILRVERTLLIRMRRDLRFAMGYSVPFDQIIKPRRSW